MYSFANTVGEGLGFEHPRLLAHGLGYEIEVEIVIIAPVISTRPGGGGARTYYFPDASITIRISLEGRLVSQQKFKVDQREIPNVVAKLKLLKLSPMVSDVKIIRQKIDRIRVEVKKKK